MIFAFFLGCESAAERNARCTEPLAALVHWRVASEGRAEPLDYTRPNEWPPRLPASELARVEREHVEAALVKMRPLEGCEEVWRMITWSPPDNPAGRLRDEAVRQAMGYPTVPYDVVAIGGAGVTTDGRKPGEK